MRLKRHFYLGLMLLFIVIITACSNNSDQQKKQTASSKPVVVATISQIGQPLSVIAGDFVDIRTLMGTGVDPHLYQVTPSDIKSLEQSEAIIYNGLNLEANMGDIFTQMRTSKSVIAIAEVIDENKLLREDDGVIDPHIWFDLSLWSEALAKAVDVIAELVPEHQAELEKNKMEYFEQLKELDEQNKRAISQIDSRSRLLVTAHDAFQYFGRAYNIEVVGLQGLSTEAEVSLSTVQNIVALLVERQVPAVFIESSVNPASIKAVIDGAAVKGHTVQLGGELFSDAMGPENEETGTYLGMYHHNIKTIVEGLQLREVGE